MVCLTRCCGKLWLPWSRDLNTGGFQGWQVLLNAAGCHSIFCVTAGTMEGGRQADVAKGILGAKNFPYIVAAPLLLQVRLVTALAELTGHLKSPAGLGPSDLSPGCRLILSCLCFQLHPCCMQDPPARSLCLWCAISMCCLRPLNDVPCLQNVASWTAIALQA